MSFVIVIINIDRLIDNWQSYSTGQLMLTFWRYGENGHNSHKYDFKTHPKLRQAAKTAAAKLRERVAELGYNPDVWTLKELMDWGSDLDDDIWQLINDDEIIAKLKAIIKDGNRFKNKESFHAPPVSRGIYVFPEKMVEWFLVGWKNSMRKTVINFNGNELWCHLNDECMELGVQIIASSRGWVKISSRDYRRVLRRAINNDIKKRKKDFKKDHTLINSRNASRFIALDRYEVFIVV